MAALQNQPSSKNKLTKFFLMFLLLGTLIFLCIGIYLVHITPPSQRNLVLDIVRMVFVPKEVQGEAFPGKDRITILVMGLDANWTRDNIMFTKSSRSDSMILANVFLNERKVNLLSIPRDTRVHFPDGAWDKINAAHAIGGPLLSRKVVEKLLGVSINYYVIVKFEGLKNMVDAVGGVTVDVEKTMNYDDSWGHLHIHLKKGRHRLSGQKAMEYSRFRNDAEGDYGRIRRQQQVIRALQRELLRPENLIKIPELTKTAFSNTTTDLSLKQLAALGFSLKDIAPQDMKTFTLPTVPKYYKESGYWVSYVEIIEDKKDSVLEQFASHTPLISSLIDLENIPPLTVEILDGSGIPNKAKKAAKILNEAGFTVARVSSLRSRYKKTAILDYTGRGNGLIIAKILNFGEPLSARTSNRKVDITVLLGTQ